MKKSEECKIVQDLLPSYVDKVTNEETNQFIEKHIAECDECQKILKDMGEEIVLDKISQKKEIDYLKKIKRKNIFSMLLVVIVACILICIVIKFAFFSSHVVVYDEYGRKDYIQTFWNWLIDTTPETFEGSNLSHIFVTYVSEYQGYEEQPIQNLIIFTFDEEKCIGVRCILKGEPIKSDKENFQKNYIADDFSSITNIHIEADTISYNLNIWNGKTISEVKDIIYENYPSASIEEY